MTDSHERDGGCCTPHSRWVYALAAIHVVSLISAFALPMLLPDKSDGFGAAAEAALLFIAGVGIAFIVGVVAFILGLLWRKTLGPLLTALALALLPLTVVVVALFFTIAMMRDAA